MTVKSLSELNGVWSDTELAYLAEASSIGEKKGDVRGKTLRAYEVRVADETFTVPNGVVYGYEITIYPTGNMYVYEKGQYNKKKTKATLSNKYVSGYLNRYESIKTTVKGHSSYSSALYASPELAITAKVIAIMESKVERVREAKELLSNIEKNTAKYEELYNATMEEHPELLI